MIIADIILENFVTLSLIFGMGFLIAANKSFDRRSNSYFFCFIIILLFLDISDMADFYMGSLEKPSPLRYVTSALGYTLRPATLAIIIAILLRRRHSYALLLWSPILLLGLLAFSSFLTHAIFWFSSDNFFMRGPLGFLPHIVSALYMLALLMLTVKYNRYVDLGEALIVLYAVILCISATVLETLLCKSFLLPVAMISAFTLYYIFLYVQTYKRDVLTGLLNRRSFFADAEKQRSVHLAVISMDLNGLKDINDSQGHQSGDAALRIFANACLAAAGRDYRVYRTGGDEFIALGRTKNAEDAERFIDAVREKLRSTPYMASFGCALYSGGCSFDEVCNQADAHMYEDKARYKHRACSR